MSLSRKCCCRIGWRFFLTRAVKKDPPATTIKMRALTHEISTQHVQPHHHRPVRPQNKGTYQTHSREKPFKKKAPTLLICFPLGTRHTKTPKMKSMVDFERTIQASKGVPRGKQRGHTPHTMQGVKKLSPPSSRRSCSLQNCVAQQTAILFPFNQSSNLVFSVV